MTNMVQVSKVAIRALDGIFRNGKVDQPQQRNTEQTTFILDIDSRNNIVSAAADSRSSSSFIIKKTPK